MPSGLDRVLGLTALIQCLVHVLSRDGDPSGGGDVAGRDQGDLDGSHLLVLQRNRWLATRHGLDAPLVDPRTRERTTARVLARALADRLLDVGRELGCAEFLRSLRSWTWEPTDASSQVRAYSRRENLKDVVRLMTRVSASGPRVPSLSPSLESRSVMTSLGAYR
jgi:carboxylate-amine ligase